MSVPPIHHESKGRIVVVCATDANYALALAALVRSALLHLAPERSLCLYILDGGLGEENRKRLIKSWEPETPEVHWLEPDGSTLGHVPVWGRMKRPTYYRLLMPRILPPSVEKAIWLDCDILVRADLGRLWDEDIGHHALLAVQDLVVPYVSSRYGLADFRELELSPETAYFNAGVLIINLERWRRENVTDRVLSYLRNSGAKGFFWDQDGLNAVLAREWGELDPRWNQIAGVAGRSFFRAPHLTAISYRRLTENPWIVHYAGFWKPWIFENSSTSRESFFETLDQTAWTGWRPEPSFRARLLGLYEERLRDHLYSLENLYMVLSRAMSRRKRVWSRNSCGRPVVKLQ